MVYNIEKKLSPWRRHAALLDVTRTGKSLQIHLHQLGALELLPSLIVLQLEKLQWPMPNEITYQPYTIFQRDEKGPDLVKLLKKKLRPTKKPDPITLVITTDNRKVETEKLLHRFPKELLRLDITTRHLNLTN